MRISSGIKQMVASRLGIILVPPLFWLVWMAVTFTGLNTPEALDQAQAARHVARGDGFVTSVIQPLSLALVPKLEKHPNLSHPPVFTLWEALLFRVSGARPRLAALASGLSWIVACWLLFSLAARLFDRRIALFATALFLVNLACLRSSVSALPPLLTGALLLGILFTLIERQASDGSEEAAKVLPWRRLAASAVLAGLTILSDYSLVWAATIPLLIFWMRWPRAAGMINGRTGVARRLGRTLPLTMGLGFAVVLLLAVSPWLVRNTQVAGHPLVSLNRYELLTQTRAYPGLVVYRRYDPLMPQPWEFTNQHPLQVTRKAVVGFGTLAQGSGSLINVVILALFVLACLRPPTGTAGRVQRYFLLMLLIQSAKLSFTSQNFGLLLAFVPAMTLFAAAALPRLLGMAASTVDELTGAPWWMRRRAAPLWVAWCLAAFPLLADRVSRGAAAAVTPSANVSFLASKTPRGSAIMTDMPALVAWYADRPAVWLAQDVNEMLQMERKTGQIPWLYFSRYRGVGDGQIAPWWVAALRDPLGTPAFSPYPSMVDGEALLSHRAEVSVARESSGADVR